MLSVGASDPRKPNVGRMISIAQRLTFPFLILNFIPSEDGDEPSTSIDIKSDKKIIDYLKKVYGGNKILLYLDPDSGKIEAWSASMLLSVDFMNERELMSSIEEWTNNAKLKLLSAIEKKIISLGD